MKVYKCVCRVCGALHDYEASFLSVDYSRVMSDGSTRLVVNCPGVHTRDEIVAAWEAR
jgi:hypothetical protein